MLPSTRTSSRALLPLACAATLGLLAFFSGASPRADAQEILLQPAPTEPAPPPQQPVAPPVTTPPPPLDPWGNPLPVCGDVAPYLQGDSWITAFVDQELVYRVQLGNAEFAHCWKELEIDLVDLPRGATFTYFKDLRYGELRWNPAIRDTGVHPITGRIRTPGRDWTSARYEVRVSDEWETFFMPGLQYVTHLPANRAKLGILHGVSVEYLLAAWIHRNENRGPSHGRVYIDIDLLQSTEAIDPALAYHLGLNFSLERNPRRTVAIPFFGAESGGFYQKELGNVFQVTPLAGLHLWADRNLFVNIVGGYLFPFSDLEDLRGWRVRAGLNISFW